jgi:CDP-6-deoxy-D-xylo-4-hexulose-3-dehydrase
MTYDYPCAFSCWGEEEAAAIDRVRASGKWTMAAGDECHQFEAEFAAYHGMRHGIMVNSGSSANLVAVAALFHKAENPLQRGDKAVVPALAWATTYAPLVQHGLDLVVADVDASWNAPALRHNARLVVGCSVLGNPGHLASWQAGAEYFIEDNCESLGASLGDGRLCGTFGLMSTFSFFHSHQLSAIEGGMILTNDDEMARLCRLLRNHGNSGFLDKPDDFDATYDFVLMGYNVRPLELHAAIARAQLPKLKKFQHARCENLAHFRHAIGRAPVIMPRLNGSINPFGVHFQVDTKETRARLAKSLRANAIDCRLPAGGSFLRHKYGEPWRGQKTPNADRIHDTGLFLGNAPFDIRDKVERAAEIIRSVL